MPLPARRLAARREGTLVRGSSDRNPWLIRTIPPFGGGGPFDLAVGGGTLENLDLSLAPRGGAGGDIFDAGPPAAGDLGNISAFTVSGAGKVDFGNLGSSGGGGAAGGGAGGGGKGLFDLDSLSGGGGGGGGGNLLSGLPGPIAGGSAPADLGGLSGLSSLSGPQGAPAAGSPSGVTGAPEPEIDFSLLSNPDKKKVLKNLEDLDFSKSDLSGSGASKLLDGDLDFTGLSSPAAFKGEDNMYNMDDMPSLGGSRGPTDDPFATLLNQPARPRPQSGSVINPSDVAEVEKELNKVSAQPVASPAGSGPALNVVVYQGNRAVKRFALKDGENAVGQRDDIANVRPDVDLGEYDQVGLVAPLHAKIIKEGDRYFIIDLLASTGTQLNGKNLPKNTRTPVKAGDTLTLAGNLTLKLEP